MPSLRDHVIADDIFEVTRKVSTDLARALDDLLAPHVDHVGVLFAYEQPGVSAAVTCVECWSRCVVAVRHYGGDVRVVVSRGSL